MKESIKNLSNKNNNDMSVACIDITLPDFFDMLFGKKGAFQPTVSMLCDILDEYKDNVKSDYAVEDYDYISLGEFYKNNGAGKSEEKTICVTGGHSGSKKADALVIKKGKDCSWSQILDDLKAHSKGGAVNIILDSIFPKRFNGAIIKRFPEAKIYTAKEAIRIF